MPEVPASVQVERPHPGMGTMARHAITGIILALAATVYSPKGSTEVERSASDLVDRVREFSGGFDSGLDRAGVGRCGEHDPGSDVSHIPGPRSGSGRSGRSINDRRVPSVSQPREGAAGPTRGGKGFKRAIGNMKRINSTLMAEVEINEALINDEFVRRRDCPSHVDLLEGFAGEAMTTVLAPSFGLSAVQPADTIYGWDLASEDGRRMWKQVIETRKPYLVIMGFPCTVWCLFNKNMNYSNRGKLLESLRDAERPLLKLVAWTARKQAEGGRYFLIEQPPTSDAWKEPIIQAIDKIPRTVSGIGTTSSQ